MSFDYRIAIEEDIVRMARAMIGLNLGQLGGSFADLPAARAKGEVGLAVERFFGMPANSISGADFGGAGIELKVVPLIRSGRGFRSKERTVIGMIDYGSIVNEEWETAHVRKKLDILFIFYEWVRGAPKREFRILGAELWKPGGEEAYLRSDWLRVRDKVRSGFAHELSESDGRLMGPCTKGAHGRARVSQPVATHSPTARPRAFALKPAFTYAIFRRGRGSQSEMESLMASLSVNDVDDFESALVRNYGRFVGSTLREVAEALNVKPSSGKGYAASVVRSALGARSAKAPIEEFVEMGITIRISRVSPELRPYEAMSFPAFRYRDLVEEEWEDSTLLEQLDGVFIFPLEGGTKATAPNGCVLREPYLWRPTSTELDIARKEWETFRDLIAKGRADDLPTAADTRILHVRPHARDASDTDDAPGLGPVVRKSFWLNQSFVQELLRRAGR